MTRYCTDNYEAIKFRVRADCLTFGVGGVQIHWHPHDQGTLCSAKLAGDHRPQPRIGLECRPFEERRPLSRPLRRAGSESGSAHRTGLEDRSPM